jgi:SnoaL-like domain
MKDSRTMKTLLLLVTALLMGSSALAETPAPVTANATLEQRIVRLEDIRALQNLLGYYEEYQSALQFDRVLPLFALEAPDVRWEPGPGAWIGPDDVRAALMSQQHQENDPQWARIHSGEMHVHTLATPIIVIADDGKTAKATFDSPGLETLSGIGHKPDARRGWCRYGVDFLKTDTGWKIWHLHVYGVIFSPANKSWVDAPGFPPPPKATDVGGEWPKPTRPQSDVWIYSGHGTPPLLPRPPEPYRTFSETFSY